MNNFGQLLREARIARGVTLSEFCLSNGLDPANQSKYERGLLTPPHPKKIAKWLKLLGYKQRKDLCWQQIMWAARDAQCEKVWDRFDGMC